MCFPPTLRIVVKSYAINARRLLVAHRPLLRGGLA